MIKWDKASLPEPIAVQIYLILATLIPTLLAITFSPHSLSLNLKRLLLSTIQRIIIKINSIKDKIFNLENTLKLLIYFSYFKRERAKTFHLIS